METSLKPCPFCGSANIDTTQDDPACADCWAQGPQPRAGESGVAAWNRRVQQRSGQALALSPESERLLATGLEQARAEQVSPVPPEVYEEDEEEFEQPCGCYRRASGSQFWCWDHTQKMMFPEPAPSDERGRK